MTGYENWSNEDLLLEIQCDLVNDFQSFEDLKIICEMQQELIIRLIKGDLNDKR